MSFCTVKFGANEERLINPNCLSSVLLTHLKKTCFDKLGEPPEHIDLATEAGEVVDLHGKPKEYAKKVLESRANYILVKVTAEETDDLAATYTPLLDQVGEKIKFSCL
ncbi:hypothetical protein BCR33DRAFT_720782 [Rhizoclosmatium globosum]|uniref:Uncharacterized protein n=1 Tax=Rhizoclosmatium globosum TaxID=329046 RepID=A0A1Y2BWA7_9FUNG|nr:hypothetical protein BCR33DRAFT_720782 [Rhizoclosmatium globosum]|eukprot:ORY38415.1 hypothetical protein BCR33DRAFT_720782 [Rhizoclosmatium globosum]